MATSRKSGTAKAAASKAPSRKAAGVKIAIKGATKAAAKPALPAIEVPKAAATKPAQPVKPVKPVKPAKAEKTRKPKLVRDSFTIPKPEYAVLADLKARCAKFGAPAKKSELLRAGIKALVAMGDAELAAALRSVPTLKTGRPAKV